jgi:hypothetical protein
MTGWAGPAPQRQEPRLGLLSTLAVVLLPWLDPHAETTDGPCVVT